MSREKKLHISQVVSSHHREADLIFCCFYSAVFSHRYETRAIPFPGAYINEGVKRIISLRELLCLIPPLSTTEHLLPYEISFEYIDLLDWLFTVLDPKSLERIELSSEEVRRMGVSMDMRPAITFVKIYDLDSEKSWLDLKGTKNVIYAYYGTNLENIYSIMINGINPIFSALTEPLYGEGIFLTSQMSLCSLFSPFKNTWNHGMIGKNKMRVIVLCEVIDDSSKIKRVKPAPGQDGYNHFTVRDAKYVRPKYFLLYVQPPTPTPIDLFSNESIAGMVSVVFVLFVALWLYLNRYALVKKAGDFINEYMFK